MDILLIAVGLVACETRVAARPATTATVTLGISDPITTMVPARTRLLAEAELARQLYDGLVEADSSGRVVGGLAERWEPVAGRRALRFHLRAGTRFHDGSPLTAATVVASWVAGARDTLAMPELPMLPDGGGPSTTRPRVLAALSAAVRVRDERTIEIDAPGSDSLLLQALATPTWMVPHPQQVGVGTGPWRLVAGAPGDSVLRLVSWSQPWRTRRTADTLVMRVVAPTATVGALVGGTVDCLTLVPGLARRDLSLQRAVRLVEAAPTMSFMLMMSPAVPAFDDRRLRSALAQAIDREGLPRTLGIRRSIVARGIEHAFADPRASAAWPFDVRAARARLDSLGAARPVALRVAYTRGTPIDTLAGPAAAVGSALRAAGQAVRFVETDERYGALRDGLVDLSTLTLIPSTDEPGENLGLFGQGRGDALYGAAGRWVTARDALAQAVSRARSAAARRAALRAFDEAVARDLPVIPLWFYGRAAASRLGVTGCDAGSAARRFADLRAAPAATDGTGP